MLIGTKLGLPAEEIRDIYFGAILHDIGKIGVHEEILNKADSLHNALQPDEVMQELRAGRGKQFDPRILDIFVGILSEENGKQLKESAAAREV